MTGQRLSETLLNPLVVGGDEEPTPDEMRELFDELRTIDGLDHAKESIPNWEDYTLPGDPYPIPRRTQDNARPVGGAIKGDSGYLTDTTEEDWADRFIKAVRGGSD